MNHGNDLGTSTAQRGSPAQRIAREPLTHFVLLGCLLFAAHAWVTVDDDRSAGSGDRVVKIGTDDVEWLAELWARQRDRPPEEHELRGLVSDYLREQLYAREAVELGLDENDTLIRRRLAQKMQFIVDDTARALEPDDRVLIDYYESHRERFAMPRRVWFEHVQFSGDSAESRAAAALGTIEDAADPLTVGDRSLLPVTFEGEDEAAIDRLLGDGFAKGLAGVRAGGWAGPIRSAYGAHLVRVSRVEDAAAPDFAEVSDRVLEAWHVEQQQAADERYLAELMSKYVIVVDEPVKRLLQESGSTQ